LRSLAVPTSAGAIGRPRSGGGDDLTAEITAKCFAGMSRGKVCDGLVESFAVAGAPSSLWHWLKPSNRPTRCPASKQ